MKSAEILSGVAQIGFIVGMANSTISTNQTPDPQSATPSSPWVSFETIYAEVRRSFTPPPSRRAIRRVLRRAGVPECKPTSLPAQRGHGASAYFLRSAAEAWIAEQNPANP